MKENVWLLFSAGLLIGMYAGMIMISLYMGPRLEFVERKYNMNIAEIRVDGKSYYEIIPKAADDNEKNINR